MNSSFGVSESLILSGTFLVTSSMLTEGWILIALGTISGFARFSTWIGQSLEKDNQS